MRRTRNEPCKSRRGALLLCVPLVVGVATLGLAETTAQAQGDEPPAASGADLTEQRVVAIIADQLDVERAEIVPEASLAHYLGADSLDQVELVMALEEHFGIEIPDEDCESLLTVQDIINYCENR